MTGSVTCVENGRFLKCQVINETSALTFWQYFCRRQSYVASQKRDDDDEDKDDDDERDRGLGLYYITT